MTSRPAPAVNTTTSWCGHSQAARVTPCVSIPSTRFILPLPTVVMTTEHPRIAFMSCTRVTWLTPLGCPLGRILGSDTPHQMLLHMQMGASTAFVCRPWHKKVHMTVSSLLETTGGAVLMKAGAILTAPPATLHHALPRSQLLNPHICQRQSQHPALHSNQPRDRPIFQLLIRPLSRQRSLHLNLLTCRPLGQARS
jgi:hypothetical protein